MKSVEKVSKEQPRSQGSLVRVPTERRVGERTRNEVEQRARDNWSTF